MEQFLGTSQYTNCAGEVREVDIACATTDDAAAFSTTTTTGLCSYAEHPQQDDDAAAGATAVGCGDHGSFDPQAHLTRDHVTGACRLNFVALFDSCDAAPLVAGGGFGVMVEAPLRTSPGAHDHHEPNKDKNPKDNNSGLLLRFSNDAGATYYNFKDPRNTVPLDRSSPRRKLEDVCTTACGKKFQGWSCDSVYQDRPAFFISNEDEQCVNNAGGFKKTKDRHEAFETCFALGDPKGTTFRCWSKSHYSSEWRRETPCVPNDDVLNPNPNLRRWYIAQPRDNGSCGPPCGWDGFKSDVDYDSSVCDTPVGSTFQGWSCDNKHDNNFREGCFDKDFSFVRWEDNPFFGYFEHPPNSERWDFETCFGLGGPNGNRCWSKSHHDSTWGGNYPCVPKALIIDGTPMKWHVTKPLSDGTCGEPCNYEFNEWVQEPDHCLLPGAHVSPNWAPNWCECNFDLVNDPAYIGDNKCPGQDKPICAIHCESNFAFDLSCSDYSKYCYSINMNKCYCRY